MWLAAALEGVALLGGTVHTLEPGAAAVPATVLIEDGRIAALGADVAVPADARRVDATGLHLIPGLIDGLVHHDPDHDRLYVASGVTLVRDAGNDLARILAERAPAARARGPGPDLWIAGAVLDGLPPATTESIVLASLAEADDKLPRLFELGVDYVATYAGLEPEIWRRAVELAHAAGLAVWGPRPRRVTLAEYGAGGADGLFHLDGLLAAGAAWETVSAEDLAPAVAAVAEAGLALTPTLAAYGERLVPPRADAPELAYLGPFYVEAWRADLELRRRLALEDPEGFVRRGLAVVETQGRVLRMLHEKGVRLVPGSGSPHPWLLPGEALLAELSLWRRAGIPQAEVLRLATAGAAEVLGCAAERGTLAPGKIADLVGVRGDPTQDLDLLHRPELVVLRGRVLARAELDALLADLAATQARLAAEQQRPLAVSAPELPEGDVLLAGLVETRAGGQRVSAERFAVVREPDGTLAYCGRVRTPGAASYGDAELGIEQRIRNGKLAAFRLRIQGGPGALTFEGERGAGALRLVRKLDGEFQGEVKIAEPLAFVEAGSVTAQLILGRETAPGPFRALFFEDAEPATGAFELALDDEHTHLVRGPQGDLVARFDPRGFPELVVRRRGAVVVETRTIEHDELGGPGLALPEAKRPRPQAAAPDRAGDGAGEAARERGGAAEDGR